MSHVYLKRGREIALAPRPHTFTKARPIMAMERFQRLRDLLADSKPSQSEMSLLDAPANGMYTTALLILIMANFP